MLVIAHRRRHRGRLTLSDDVANRHWLATR